MLPTFCHFHFCIRANSTLAHLHTCPVFAMMSSLVCSSKNLSVSKMTSVLSTITWGKNSFSSLSSFFITSSWTFRYFDPSTTRTYAQSQISHINSDDIWKKYNKYIYIQYIKRRRLTRSCNSPLGTCRGGLALIAILVDATKTQTIFGFLCM